MNAKLIYACMREEGKNEIKSHRSDGEKGASNLTHTRINFHTNQSIEISFEKLFIFIRKGRGVESRIHNKTRDFRMNYGKQLTADSELH